MLKMQKLVYERIVSNTRDIRWDLPEGLTAGELAGELGVGRNTVSQYLNEYVEQGEFVKIKSRPVLFLDRRAQIRDGLPAGRSARAAQRRVRDRKEHDGPADARIRGESGDSERGRAVCDPEQL